MQKVNNVEYKNISIDEIIEPEWDIRKDSKDDDDHDLNGLVQSIKKDGVIQPIIVSKTKTDKYEIFAGRRRYKACKILRLKEIPARIESQSYDRTDKQRIALIENLHRKELEDTEKGVGILAVYEAAGYTGEQAISGTKSIDNYLINTKTKWDEIESTELIYVLNQRCICEFSSYKRI